jgi:hypothetical protein
VLRATRSSDVPRPSAASVASVARAALATLPMRVMRAGGGWFACALAAACLASPARATDVHYRLRYERDGDAAHWTVEVLVTDASPRDGALRFELDGFGGWQDLGHPYLQLVSATPEPRRSDPGAGRFEIAVPRRGDEALQLVYRIDLLAMHGEAQRARGLLPAAGEAYAFGWSWNVLAQVSDDEGPVRGRRTLELLAQQGCTIVTGWAGRSTGSQTVELAPGMGNAPIAFGEPAYVGLLDDGGHAVEVYQFGAGTEIADVVAGFLARASPVLGRLFGAPARSPYRAFVTDHQGGGMGSHFGLRIAHTAEEPPERRDSPWLPAFVLHEHIHDWLGLTVTDADEELVWFKEGFTEYLSLWTAAATGLVPREYFATRLLELEEIARTRSALGEVRFGDPTVRWRDGDGPIETLAYTGAPLLALLADVELRGRGRPGLPALVAELVADGPRTIDRRDLKAAFAAAGLGTLWKRSVDGTDLPPLLTLLPRAGFELVDEPADLTYLGLRTDADGPGARVLAVDPDGPAAAAGVQKGDVITGYYPVRQAPVLPRAGGVAGKDARFGFGLGLFLPGEPGAYLGLRRGETDLRAEIVPEVLQGAGALRRWAGDEQQLDRFFSTGA